jgi:hypothetical protein
LVAVAVLLAAGAALAFAVSGGDSANSSSNSTLALTIATDAEGAERRAVERALRRGVAEAEELGGAVEAAAILAPWRAPVVVASPPGGGERWMRMWSMSKIVTAVAMLRAKGWGEQPGEELSPEVEEALRAAVTRSENCPARRLVVELQHSHGDSPERAREAIAEVLRVAGGRARPGEEIAPPDPGCVEFLETQTEVPEPLAPALLLGTSEWRVGDAVLLMRALGQGTYGEAVSQRLLGLMREPKLPNREALPGELTAPVEWGAARALGQFDPAYKAGWGGTQQGAFMAGQMALLELPGGGRAAVAVVFHPAVQPSRDDPGLTEAPAAVETVMRSLAAELEGDQQPGSPR